MGSAELRQIEVIAAGAADVYDCENSGCDEQHAGGHRQHSGLHERRETGSLTP